MQKCDFRFDPWSAVSDPEWFDRDLRWFIDSFTPAVEPAGAAKGAGPSLSVKTSEDSWRVTSGDERFQGLLGTGPRGFEVVARGQQFGGEIIAAKREWRMRAPDAEMRGGGAGGLARDIRTRFGAGRMIFDSDKCDWRVVAGTRELVAAATLESNALSLNARMPGFRGMMSSSKCDWRIDSLDDRVRVEMQQRETAFDMSVTGPEVTAEVSSSEKTFSFRALPSADASVRMPSVSAELGSHKSDFQLRVDVRAGGDATFRLRAVGSAKCDFRFESLEIAENGRDFRAVAIDSPKKPSA